MLVHRRVLTLILVVGLLLSFFYFFAFWPRLEFLSGRHPLGRSLGIVGWAMILATCGSYAWQRRRTSLKAEQDTWHAGLAGIAVWLILLHSSLRFGNVIATLAFLTLLGGVISGVLVKVCDYKLVQFTTQSSHTENLQALTLRYNHRRQRWLSVHLAFISALLTFTVVHILSVLYYS